ncbi:MAG: lysophospholipid acyltransferase family protein [Bacteroidales bacterium]
MRYLGYIFTYFAIWLLHILPGPVFYLFSDFFSFFTHRVVGYRKKVVRENLRKSFPQYSLRQLRETERKFYRHLCDLILESAVVHFYSEKQLLDKISCRNPELLDHYYKEGRPMIAVTGHYGNWEYLTNLGIISSYQEMGAYKPLRNPYFDRMVRKNREKFRAVTAPMEQIARKMFRFERDGVPTLTIFLGDQRPMFHQIQYWTKFMGQDTPMFLGAEKLARKLNAVVVFLKVRKTGRGHYEVEVVPVCDDPGSTKPYEITEKHVRALEDLIREEPAYWLWSHRRWKHTLEKYREACPDKLAPDS